MQTWEMTWNGKPKNEEKIFHFFNVFSAGSMNLTNLKACKNQKYNFSTETFNCYAPKCSNVSQLLPHVLYFKKSLRNKQKLFIVKHPEKPTNT